MRKRTTNYLERGSPEFLRKESDSCIFLNKDKGMTISKKRKLLPIEKYMEASIYRGFFWEDAISIDGWEERRDLIILWA